MAKLAPLNPTSESGFFEVRRKPETLVVSEIPCSFCFSPSTKTAETDPDATDFSLLDQEWNRFFRFVPSLLRVLGVFERKEFRRAPEKAIFLVFPYIGFLNSATPVFWPLVFLFSGAVFLKNRQRGTNFPVPSRTPWHQEMLLALKSRQTTPITVLWITAWRVKVEPETQAKPVPGWALGGKSRVPAPQSQFLFRVRA